MSQDPTESPDSKDKKGYAVVETTAAIDPPLSYEDEYDEKNPFGNPTVAAHWNEVYESSRYECRHVFDPALTWTEEEEKKLVRKLDWRVCLWAVLGDSLTT